ncbi:rhodanese-like domain-containing protein [Rhizobium herbae]|jgi:rhodanese-related sulfurtransferase
MTISTIGPAQAAQWIAKGEAILVDVREPDEFKAEHIARAASVPLGSLKKTFDILSLPIGSKVIFQCLKGSRGAEACQMAAATASFSEVYNLQGGISAWKEAGLPVVGTSSADQSVPSIFRQVQMAVGTFVAAAVIAGFAGWDAGFLLAGLLGMMLAMAGLTGWCGLAMLLARMPWNRRA